MSSDKWQCKSCDRFNWASTLRCPFCGGINDESDHLDGRPKVRDDPLLKRLKAIHGSERTDN